MKPLGLAVLLPLILATGRHAQERTLDGSNPVSNIALMIQHAEPGDTIRIPAGVYHGNLVITKPIVLDGAGHATLDALGVGTVVEVRADHVTIRACSIRASNDNVTGEHAGIRVLAPNATIEDNTIEDTLFGIDLKHAADSVIQRNTIVGKKLEPGRRGDGIRLWWSHGCTVQDNSVRDSRDMVFWYSENLRITRNTVSDCRYGLHFMYSHDTVLDLNTLKDNSVGIYLMYSNRITLNDNQLTNNRGASGYAIGLKDCDDILIAGNTLLANRVGLYIDNSPSSSNSTGIIESNLIAFNEIGLLATPNTHGNVLTANAFVENEEPAATHGRGRLVSNSFARDRIGNYWSEYAGFDLDNDGVGDVAYEPRSLFNALLANHPNLRLFVHSPAQHAIEFTARALPELRPESTMIDPAPLVSPPPFNHTLRQINKPQDPRMALLAGVLILTSVAGVVIVAAERGIHVADTGDRP